MAHFRNVVVRCALCDGSGVSPDVQHARPDGHCQPCGGTGYVLASATPLLTGSGKKVQGELRRIVQK